MKQNGQHFADCILKWIFFKRKCCNFDGIFTEDCFWGSNWQQTALLQTMTWHQTGDKQCCKFTSVCQSETNNFGGGPEPFVDLSSILYLGFEIQGTRAYNFSDWVWNTGDKPLPGGRFKNTFELLNLRALKISMLYKNHIFQCMGKIFCVEFQRVPLKFHTKYLTHTLKDVDFICNWKFMSS